MMMISNMLIKFLNTLGNKSTVVAFELVLIFVFIFIVLL